MGEPEKVFKIRTERMPMAVSKENRWLPGVVRRETPLERREWGGAES